MRHISVQLTPSLQTCVFWLQGVLSSLKSASGHTALLPLQFDVAVHSPSLAHTTVVGRNPQVLEQQAPWDGSQAMPANHKINIDKKNSAII